MSDVFTIVVACIIGIILVGVNFYILALYCHRKTSRKLYNTINFLYIYIKAGDKGFGASLFGKILVVNIKKSENIKKNR